MNHSVFRMFRATKDSPQRWLSSFYVTIIGTFLTCGVYLDILCTCGPNRNHSCCDERKYATSLAGVTFIVALAWTLINKLVFEYFLAPAFKKVIRHSTRSKGKPSLPTVEKEGFRISKVICIIGMVVVVIAGLIAVAFYSFKFVVIFFNSLDNRQFLIEITKLEVDWNGRD